MVLWILNVLIFSLKLLYKYVSYKLKDAAQKGSLLTIIRTVVPVHAVYGTLSGTLGTPVVNVAENDAIMLDAVVPIITLFGLPLESDRFTKRELEAECIKCGLTKTGKQLLIVKL